MNKYTNICTCKDAKGTASFNLFIKNSLMTKIPLFKKSITINIFKLKQIMKKITMNYLIIR